MYLGSYYICLPEKKKKSVIKARGGTPNILSDSKNKNIHQYSLPLWQQFNNPIEKS